MADFTAGQVRPISQFVSPPDVLALQNILPQLCKAQSLDVGILCHCCHILEARNYHVPHEKSRCPLPGYEATLLT